MSLTTKEGGDLCTALGRKARRNLKKRRENTKEKINVD